MIGIKNINIGIFQDKPYVFIKKKYAKEVSKMKEEGKRVCGNHYFEGFCIDLAQKVTEILNITNYTVCLVQDGQYGAIQANQTWNGMIGELMQKVIIGTVATFYRVIVCVGVNIYEHTHTHTQLIIFKIFY